MIYIIINNQLRERYRQGNIHKFVSLPPSYFQNFEFFFFYRKDKLLIILPSSILFIDTQIHVKIFTNE